MHLLERRLSFQVPGANPEAVGSEGTPRNCLNLNRRKPGFQEKRGLITQDDPARRWQRCHSLWLPHQRSHQLSSVKTDHSMWKHHTSHEVEYTLQSSDTEVIQIQGICRAEKPFCKALQWWTRAITHLSKFTGEP